MKVSSCKTRTIVAFCLHNDWYNRWVLVGLKGLKEMESQPDVYNERQNTMANVEKKRKSLLLSVSLNSLNV